MDLIKKIALKDEKISQIGLSMRKITTDAIRVFEKSRFRNAGKVEDDEDVFVMQLDG
ncbi:MAG: hypothetical protein JW795_23865 [Chitinivibrionales bacterium]|nr:hypothetical protein [Chitinivibrionales bacterium]